MSKYPYYEFAAAPGGIVGQVVDRLHVSASPMQVLRAIRAALAAEARNAPELLEGRKEIYRMALAQHAYNRDLYRAVMSGRL